MRQTMSPEMPERMAARICAALARAGVTVWIDGGWGVDALLARQTRAHGDLDLVVAAADLEPLMARLDEMGFAVIDSPDQRAWNFVLGDDAGHRIDLHVVVFETSGDGIYGPPENGESYPAAAFAGRGDLAGQQVHCMTAEFQIANRRGYALRDVDLHDIRVLRAAFGI